MATKTDDPQSTPETPDPTPGRIVLYTLTEGDAARIDVERNAIGARGNAPAEGDVVPLIVVRAWDGRLVNGQAVLDGNDNMWVASAAEGDEPGTWRYPVRA